MWATVLTGFDRTGSQKWVAFGLSFRIVGFEDNKFIFINFVIRWMLGSRVQYDGVQIQLDASKSLMLQEMK